MAVIAGGHLSIGLHPKIFPAWISVDLEIGGFLLQAIGEFSSGLLAHRYKPGVSPGKRWWTIDELLSSTSFAESCN
jgi:hypothetical protein